MDKGEGGESRKARESDYLAATAMLVAPTTRHRFMPLAEEHRQTTHHKGRTRTIADE